MSLPQAALSSVQLDSSVEDRKEKDRVKEDSESNSRSVDTSLRKGPPTISVRALVKSSLCPQEGVGVQICYFLSSEKIYFFLIKEKKTILNVKLL